MASTDGNDRLCFQQASQLKQSLPRPPSERPKLDIPEPENTAAAEEKKEDEDQGSEEAAKPGSPIVNEVEEEAEAGSPIVNEVQEPMEVQE